MGTVLTFSVVILGSQELLSPALCVYTTAVAAMVAEEREEKRENDDFFHPFWVTRALLPGLMARKRGFLSVFAEDICWGVQELRPSSG